MRVETTPEEISAEIKAYISANFLFDIDADEEVDGNSNLFEFGILDSYGLVEIITFLETRFNAKLEEADLTSGKLISVNGLAEVVFGRVKR